jgi:protein-tyrosine phosphatase
LEDGVKSIKIPGTLNARDAFANTNSPDYLKGKFFRSALLSKLTPEGGSVLEGLGVNAVIDLRSRNEVVKDGPALVPDSVEVFVLDELLNEGTPLVADFADPNEHLKKAPSVKEQIDVGFKAMQHIYWKFAMAPDYQQRFAEGLKIVADYPVVWFNCSAGKDRTGFFAMLLHNLAGTPKADIFHDYLISQRANEEFGDFFNVQFDNAEKSMLRTIFSVQPEMLQHSLDVIDEHFGSVSGYLEEIGIDASVQKRIKAKMTG